MSTSARFSDNTGTSASARRPDVRDFELPIPSETYGEAPEMYRFSGILMGEGTSQRDAHRNHVPGRPPSRGVRCSRCRWTETTIYWSETDSTYVVHIIGRSAVPGEHDKISTSFAETAAAVLDALLIKSKNASGRYSLFGDRELPQPNADALDEAGEMDPGLLEELRSWDSGN